MINNFTRDSCFFQSLSESNMDITYNDFDNEINNLVNYLNRKVVTTINNIGENSYSGILDNAKYIIKNIGNGKVTFDSLKDVNYENNGIGFYKIDNIFLDPFSLLFVNSTSEITLCSIKFNNDDGGGIFGNINDYKIGIKLEGKNFYEEAILSNNIASNTIIIDHINDAGKIHLLQNIQVENRHIINESIGNNKIAYKAITYNKLDQEIKTYRERDDIFLTYQDNSISVNKIKDNSFDMRLISNNLNKFGKGILDKRVIPLREVVIAKPDNLANETIDTYKLCIYSISRAYQLNTYEEPQSDKVYLNPDYTKTLDLYNSVSKQLIDSNNYLSQLYNLCIFQGMALLTIDDLNSTIVSENYDIYQTYLERVNNYQTQKKYYDNLYAYLININANLQKIPKNIYTQVPPIIYQKLEAVPNTKAYKKVSNQSSIKSYHLKDNSFNILNIPDRINYNNVPNEKFINKYALHINLQRVLGLV